MTWKTIALWSVLVDFTGMSFYALSQVGVVGFIESVSGGGIVSWTIFADLMIALGLVCLWMIQDAKARGVSAIPYLVATLLLGSVGPLLYLTRRGGEAASEIPKVVEQAA